MDFQASDLYLMDYDTYHQIIGGSFLDYTEWIAAIKSIQLEDLSLQKDQEEISLSIGTENFKEESPILLDILLFLLEFLCDHYGTFSPSKNYPNMSVEEKIQELFSFYSSVGMSQENTLNIVKKYFKSLGKGKIK